MSLSGRGPTDVPPAHAADGAFLSLELGNLPPALQGEGVVCDVCKHSQASFYGNSGTGSSCRHTGSRRGAGPASGLSADRCRSDAPGPGSPEDPQCVLLSLGINQILKFGVQL